MKSTQYWLWVKFKKIEDKNVKKKRLGNINVYHKAINILHKINTCQWCQKFIWLLLNSKKIFSATDFFSSQTIKK